MAVTVAKEIKEMFNSDFMVYLIFQRKATKNCFLSMRAMVQT
jgi:hypothetical protein